jgi:hypothetical protein
VNLSRDSIVDIATGYRLDNGVGVQVPVGWRIFSALLRRVLGPTQPPIQWLPGGVKQLGHEADCSPPASADVKKMWICISTPPYAFMAWCLTQGQLNLFLYSELSDASSWQSELSLWNGYTYYQHFV